ncbi:DUF721 domain-containing protein [bacterium]|nr:DUF721 domain-containing protein [bacterium]
MGKLLYSNFETTSEIIETMLEESEIKRTVKRATLYSFWDKIVPQKFKDKSKPYGMIGKNVMSIACENHIIAQELTLIKSDLIEKFKPYSKSLKIKVTDFKFDPKKWSLL